jgi:hypothetical protein
VGDRVWLQLNEEIVQDLGKNIKDLQYDPFEVLDKVGDNTYRHSPLPYMHIYSVVNVENLKLYEPTMLDKVLPTIKELSPYAHAELVEDIIFHRKCKTTR